jgi:hypothetical protein
LKSKANNSSQFVRRSLTVLALYLVSVFQYLVCMLPVSAESLDNADQQQADISKIEHITNALVEKELEMLNLDTRFRLESSKSKKWKPWRVFAYRLAGSSLTEAGMTTLAVSRWKYYQHPQQAPQNLLEAGPICNVTAASIVIGGTLTEAVLDQLHDHKLKQSGLDIKSGLHRFLELRSQVDGMLLERSSLVRKSSMSDLQKQIVEADGDIVSDIRDLACVQFANYYMKSQKAKVTRDTGTVLTLAGAATGGYLGSLNSLLAVTNHNPQGAGVAGIGFIVSGAIVALTPLLVGAAGKISSHITEHKLQQVLGNLNTKTTEAFEADRQRLSDLIAKTDKSELALFNGLSTRTSAYELQTAIFENQIEVAQKQAQRQDRSLRERLVFSSLVGGSNLARGVQLELAGFKYDNSPSQAFLLTATASTTYMAGAGIWVLNTLQDRVRAEMLKRKTQGAQLSVKAKLEQRLSDIEEVEDAVSLY